MSTWARWLLATAVLAAVVVAVVVYLQRTDVSKNYEQTWPKSYATTTCAEWNDEMSHDQQFAGAADMLWQDLKSRGVADRPDYDDVVNFQSAIDQQCGADATANLATVGSGFSFPD